MQRNSKFKNGGVSMFLVIAVCVLVSVIVASFIRLMIRDQQQASSLDLSQSAYDSAQVGVEDAKRFYSKYVTNCGAGTVDNTECNAMKKALNPEAGQSRDCYTLAKAGIATEGKETFVQKKDDTASKNELNQAYTCVTLNDKTADYLGEIENDGKSAIVPLKAVAPFNKVEVSWFTSKNLGSKTLNLPTNAQSLLPAANASSPDVKWSPDGKITPPIARMQFFHMAGANANLDDFNNSFSQGVTGANTIFGLPASAGTNTPTLASDNGRSTGKAKPQNIKCESLDSKQFSCRAMVDLGYTVNPASNLAYLRLTTIYGGAEYSVKMYNGSTPVNFDGVQIEVDSTGRANDLFRRVKSRIEPVGNLIIPDFALEQTDTDASGNKQLCKDFWVSNITEGSEVTNCFN